jgi:hypothetical protein
MRQIITIEVLNNVDLEKYLKESRLSEDASNGIDEYAWTLALEDLTKTIKSNGHTKGFEETYKVLSVETFKD